MSAVVGRAAIPVTVKDEAMNTQSCDKAALAKITLATVILATLAGCSGRSGPSGPVRDFLAEADSACRLLNLGTLTESEWREKELKLRDLFSRISEQDPQSSVCREVCTQATTLTGLLGDAIAVEASNQATEALRTEADAHEEAAASGKYYPDVLRGMLEAKLKKLKEGGKQPSLWPKYVDKQIEAFRLAVNQAGASLHPETTKGAK